MELEGRREGREGLEGWREGIERGGGRGVGGK